MASVEQSPSVEVKPVDKNKVLKLWKIAGILGIVTAIEFVFAFTMSRGYLLISIFVFLTIVKAFFIVAEFMHLGHEKKGLVYAIVLPMLFVLWLITACLMEAYHISDAAFSTY